MKLHFSPRSLEDLLEIRLYISEELQSPIAAQKIVLAIIERTKELLKFPEVGTPLSSKISVNTNYRFISSGNYLVFYRVTRHEIHVDRVLYSKRDYLKILFGTGDVQ